jgi:hypothetical protein
MQSWKFVKLCVLTKLNYHLNCHLMNKILPGVENFSTLFWLIHFEDLIAFSSYECERIYAIFVFQAGW